ncbi:transcriptional regulator with XRE-family HTH domain [Rhodoligotrophos appendicifer]|uniref:helix-turn-helix domain-containing protein n=1 Tax=Rhodoligotrophos appendicifer TaxID=987056 RepID=UPI001186B2BD|nr:helix-turn-helix transcriptional regulator [Rhodoligotrophos appendicifer]
MPQEQLPVGILLRDWRQRRRLSQLALAADAEISQRHLSFLESGRSRPSREMVLRLTEQLAVPLRDRNAILLAAGFAPAYPHRPMVAPEFDAAREAIERLLQGHDPHPALAVNRHWMLLSANKAVGILLSGVAGHLLVSEINVLRLSLHPEGLAPRILNFRQWRDHVLARLAREIEVSADMQLAALFAELKAYPPPPQVSSSRGEQTAHGGIAVPLKLASDEGPLSFLSATTIFGTAIDVTLSEVTIESFFPADPGTAKAMRRLAERV